MTLYELWKGRKSNVKYFHIFGSTCYILVDREYHRKWMLNQNMVYFFGYFRGGLTRTFFINRTGSDLIVAQIYADDIIFGGFPKVLVDNFIDIMKSKFEMSMIGDSSLGLQIKQKVYLYLNRSMPRTW